MTGEKVETMSFFSQQPFWEVTKQRENSLLSMEDFRLRVLRFNVNQGCDVLNCIPGVGQYGIIFSVREKEASAYVFGVLPQKKEIPMYGIEKALMVQFVPGSFTWATGIPADELPPEGVKLEDVFPWAVSTMERINEVDNEQEHFRQLGLFLAQCRDKKGGGKEKEEKLAASIAHYMMQRGRSVRMKELEECYGYTARTLQKLVLKNVGVTPKQLNLQICLQSAIQQISQDKGGSLTEISHQMDFYDQSHFNKIFRKMTGLCPGEYKRWMEENKRASVSQEYSLKRLVWQTATGRRS